MIPPRRATFVLVMLLVSGAFACATSGQSSGSRGGRNLITTDELSKEPSGTLFDAVQRLRPRWLQNRGISSVRAMRPTPPQVYVDGSPVGSTGALHSISVSDVETARYLSASDATTRFGTGHDGGAIVVTTRTGG